MITIRDQALFARIQALPKAELHLHLDGAVPAKDIFKMAQEKKKTLLRANCDIQGKPIAYQSIEQQEIKNERELSEYWMDWNNYSIPDRFGIVTGMMQTKNEIINICLAHVQDLKRQNILYAETRFAPQYHLNEGLTLDQVIGYVLEGLQKGSEETGVIVRLIVCIGREISPSQSLEIAQAAVRFQNQGVVALDLACFEPPFPPQLHEKAFRLALESGLKRTVHAGEMCSTKENLANIYEAIFTLKANGLGHALPLYQRYYGEYDLLEAMRENHIRLESNPISNLVVTGLKDPKDLHLKELLEQGILVTINSDDPAMWPSGSLAYNLYIMAEYYGEPFIHQVIANAIKAAFGLTEEEKTKLLQKFKEMGLKNFNL